ncbi:hypothetical protein [Corynebacterium vitaeruminis]|nr:hypothetical protein [Corynebacterium vitaeruminis]
MTEQDAKAKMRLAPDLIYRGAQGSLITNVLGGIANAITMGLQGIFTGLTSGFSSIAGSVKPIVDGQLSLDSRIDLLSPLLDYGAVTMPDGQPFTGTGKLPFSVQIGPMRNVEKSGTDGLKLLDAGLWDIRLHAQASWVAAQSARCEVDLVVTAPDGSEFSRQSSIDVREATANLVNPISNSGEHVHTIVSTVVVPAAGYTVHAHVVANAPTRRFYGGPRWSRLVAQHISREVNGNWADGSGTSDTA